MIYFDDLFIYHHCKFILIYPYISSIRSLYIRAVTSTKICTRVLDHVECICTRVFDGGGGGGDLTDHIWLLI